jgi:curved DNA-binding protein CbpA
MESLYDILEISSEANEKEIKAAYKRLALKYHPDKNFGDSYAEEKFKSINNAYQILSDSTRKAHYDYSRNNPYFYQNSTYTYSHNTNTYSENNHTKNSKSWTYTNEDRKRDEALAIKWMIGFFIVVIIISATLYGWQYLQDKWENEKALLRKREIIEKVKQKYAENAYRESLKELKVIKAEIPNDDDIDNLYDEVIEQLKKSADESFNQRNYAKSLDYYTTLKEYEKYPNILNTFQIAYCHRHLNNFEICIEHLQLILSESPNDLRSHVDLANIYVENLNNLEKANYHYDKAIHIIISHYKELYGDAYAVMLNIDAIPDIHYEAFIGKATLRIRKKEFNNSLRESSWAIYIRPENPKAYILKAEALFELNRISEAISQLKTAKKLGSEETEILKRKYKVND